MIKQTLIKFGLNEKEVQVYLSCLEKPGQSPFQISKHTKIPRTTVYDILTGLSLKGLVELDQSDGFSKQQTLVRPKNPSVLRTILQNKKKELTNTEADILNILPQLKSQYHKQETNSDFQYFPGIEGAKEVLFEYETTKLDLPLYSWDKLLPMDVFGEEEMQKHVAQVLKQTQQRQSPTKLLVPLTDWTKHVMSFQAYKNPNYLALRKIRYIDNPLYDIYLRLHIIGEYISMVCTEGEEMWGVKIKSKALSQTFKSFFEIQWLQAKEVTPELVKSWGENPFIVWEKA